MTSFQPWELIDYGDDGGLVLQVHNANITMPDDMLPSRVALGATWVDRGGLRLRSWFAVSNTGPIRQISLPVVPGDGEEDLGNLVRFLERNGYRDVTTDDGRPEYARD